MWRLRDHSRQFSSHDIREPIAGLDQFIQVHASADTCPLQHVNHIFARHIAGGTRSERAAAQPAERCIDNRRARIHRSPYIGEPSVAGVVKMHAHRKRLDCLTHAGVWADDSQIDALVTLRGERVQGGSVVVRIEPMQADALAMFAREMGQERAA